MEAEITNTLSAAHTTLGEPQPKIEIAKHDIVIRAIDGRANKKAAVRAEGERYDAGVREHYCKVDSHLRLVSSMLARVVRVLNTQTFELRHMNKEVEVKRRVVHWTWESVGLILAALVLLVIGTNSIATILIASKIKVFANPVRAYLWSFVPWGVTLALVGLYNVMPDSRRAGYLCWIWITGVICGAIWIALMAQVCSGFLQTAEAIIRSVLMAGTKSAAGSPVVNSPLLIACGILAEVLLSAGCSIGSRRACAVVEEAVKKSNDAYLRLSDRISKLGQLRARLEIAKINLEARLKQLDAARKSLLNDAAAWFDHSLSGHKPTSLGKKISSLFLVAALFSLLDRAVAAERQCHLVVGITPHTTETERLQTQAALLGLLLRNSWDGPVTVVDAEKCQAVGTMIVTNDDLDPATRLGNNASFFADLKTYLSQDTYTNGEILLPQLTEFIGSHLRQGDEPMAVVVIGSECYHSKEKGFIMQSNLVPSMDHIFASGHSSVHGTLGKSNLLANVAFHLIYRADDFMSKFHADTVGDFWNVYLTQQGAKLVSNSFDFETVWNRVLLGVSNPYKVVKPELIGRICMLAVIGDRLIPVEDTTPDKPAEDVVKLKNQLAQAEKQASVAAKLQAQLDAASSRSPSSKSTKLATSWQMDETGPSSSCWSILNFNITKNGSAKWQHS